MVWAAGPTSEPATNEELADRLEALGGPALGWRVHRGVELPSGARAEAVSIPVADALGWLAAVGGGLDGEGVGASVRWLGHVALVAVRQVARGAVVPTLRSTKRGDRSARDGRAVAGRAARRRDARPARGDHARARCGSWLRRRSHRAPSSSEIIGAVVDAVVTQAAGMLELPAPPPRVRTAADVGESVITRLDGSTFTAPSGAGSDVADRLQRWSKPVTSSVAAAARRAARSARPQRRLVPVGARPGAAARPRRRRGRAVGDEVAPARWPTSWRGLERLLPELQRAGALRRGQVYLSTEEAWELMTRTGESLEAAGFEVRVPSLSRRKPKPGLRLFVEPSGDTMVGARQLSNVRWSAVFDDVELTAEDVTRLAAEARPLVQSHGRWVELDRVDLKEAAAALAERADDTQLTGAEILRHAVGLEGTALGERLARRGRRLGRRPARAGRARSRARPSPSPRASSASCGRIRPRRSAGSSSSTPSGSAAASRSTWAWARRRPCSPISPAPRATVRRW